MASDQFSNGLAFPPDLDPRPTPADFRSGIAAPQAASAVFESEPDSPALAQTHVQNHWNTEVALDPRDRRQQPMRKPLDKIASLIRSLTYGEMMELAEALWKGLPESSAVTQETLPVMLYCWSISRPAASGEGEMPRK